MDRCIAFGIKKLRVRLPAISISRNDSGASCSDTFAFVTKQYTMALISVIHVNEKEKETKRTFNEVVNENQNWNENDPHFTKLKRNENENASNASINTAVFATVRNDQLSADARMCLVTGYCHADCLYQK